LNPISEIKTRFIPRTGSFLSVLFKSHPFIPSPAWRERKGPTLLRGKERDNNVEGCILSSTLLSLSPTLSRNPGEGVEIEKKFPISLRKRHGQKNGVDGA